MYSKLVSIIYEKAFIYGTEFSIETLRMYKESHVHSFVSRLSH